jgi:hypothetical protein
MTSPTPQDASPRQACIERICALFSDPPRLRTVATQRVQAWLDRQFARFNLTAHTLAVGTPEGSDHVYTRVPDLLLQRLASGQPVLYSEGFHVVAKRERENYVAAGLELAQVERMVNQQGAFLMLAWQDAWQAWWQHAVVDRVSRFEYLADALLELLYASPEPAGMTTQRFSALLPRHLLRASQSVRDAAMPGARLQIHTLHLRRQGDAAAEPGQMLPLLVFKHLILGADTQTLLLFSPSTGVRTLARVEDAIGLVPDRQALEWFALEPLDDAFSLLAAACAQAQRREVEAIIPHVETHPEQLQALLDHLTDPRRWFTSDLTPTQQRLQQAIPSWLAHASDDDMQAYMRKLAALAVVQQDAAGQDFMQGIAPIARYTANALQACLDAEPKAAGAKVEEIALTLPQVVGAGMPGGFAVGEVEQVTLSLTQLALENLRGFAHANPLITVNDKLAPARLTYALLKACVTQVDVGQRYPDLLKRTFMTDAAEATRREQLFVAQLRAQLPLLALEHKIQNLFGFTTTGYRRLEAAVQVPSPLVDGRAVALWPLAFKARPGDSADEVLNMYVIGPVQGDSGPHLLYRPLLQPALLEYPSHANLFAAIKRPGAVQESVLDWLAPARRPVYANDGFTEPHIAHVFQGDEFTPPTRPAPVQMSKQIDAGDPLHQVFVGTVQALVTLAEAQSVSAAQTRWAALKAGGWQLFAALLPLLSGPVALAGWLFQLVASVQEDIAAMADEDAPDMSLPTVDLLANLVLILAHQVSPLSVSEHPLFDRKVPSLPRSVAPGRGELINSRPSGWFNGTEVLSQALQARLERMSLRPEAATGVLETVGALKGLFRHADQWQASVRGRRYRVQVHQGSVRVISADGDTLGPWLKVLADGRWDIDLRLRLAGGNADEAIADQERTDTKTVQALKKELEWLREQINKSKKTLELARRLKNDQALSDRQRANAQESYFKELKNKHSKVLLELDVLKRIRKKTPIIDYADEKSTALEDLVQIEQLLISQLHRQKLLINAQLEPIIERIEAAGDAPVMTDDLRRDFETMKDRLRQLVTVTDDAIHWRALEDAHLEELSALPTIGQPMAQALVSTRESRPSVLDWQESQMDNLWELALESVRAKQDEVFWPQMTQLYKRASSAANSHAELIHLTGASRTEQIELLESLNRDYGETYDGLEYWRALKAEYFNLEWVQALEALLVRMREAVNRQLIELLATAPPAHTAAVEPRGRVRKKIIRTRQQELWVATVRDNPEGALEEVAELKTAKQGLVASFTEAADGVWDEVQAPAVQAVGRPALSRLLTLGQTLLDQVEPSITRVFELVATTREPKSLQALLEQQAKRLRDDAYAISQRLLHDDLSRLTATQRARAQLRVQQMTTAASRLETQGLQARVDAIKAAEPTQARVEFLVRHAEVKIFRMSARVQMRGKQKDFLQVYGVFDRQRHTFLYFAHFHYQSAEAFDDHFTVAHLKTRRQNRLGQQAQAQAQAQAFARIQAGQGGRVQSTLAIHRSEIDLSTARRLFFDAPLWKGRGQLDSAAR